MATPPSPSPQAQLLNAHLCPTIHSFTTPDVQSILARSNLNSLVHLLTPFQGATEKVTVRNSNYEPKLFPHFPVKFVERSLPAGFGEDSATRGRSGSTNTPAPPSAAVEPRTPSTPFVPPTKEERDELFLDSLAEDITRKVDRWVEGREELRVRRAVKGKKRHLEEGEEESLEEVDPPEGWEGKSVEELTPWYAALRDAVLSRREMVEWDTFNWPVACLLAVSTSHPDPLNALSALWDLTSKEKLFSPTSYGTNSRPDPDVAEWANPDVLRYVVLVHDFGAGGGRDGWEDAKELHETISKTYLHHTALLPLFSACPSSKNPQPPSASLATLWPSAPNAIAQTREVGLGVGLEPTSSLQRDDTKATQAGQELSDDDIRAIKVFLREMIVQSMIPWLERAVVVGNEQYTASKKSIGGRLFSAGRKYFGGSNTSSRSASPTNASGQPIGFNAVKGFYPYAAQESQTRRLADMAFMIGDYKLAHSVYEQASKDYRTDRAWKYFAGATRMTGLSLLLQQTPGQLLAFNPDAYLEQALHTPLPATSAATDLTRLQAVIMYYEVYRTINDWRGAPIALVRSAGESEEVASAILLEQAALADLHLPTPSRRKCGIHMAMAAVRYEKNGLKSLSRRCLSQASSLYRLPPPIPHDQRWTPSMQPWSAIRAHVHHSLGRQAYTVGKSDEAVEHFLELVNDGEDGSNGEWLEDFGLAWEHLGENASQVVKARDLKLKARIFDPKDAQIRIAHNGGIDVLADEADAWQAFESEAGIKSDMTSKGNVALIGETFYLELRARNPLDVPLAVGGLTVETDAAAGTVEMDAPQEIELGPLESSRIYVPVTASSLLSFSFLSVSFRFNDLLPCHESLRSEDVTVQDGKASTTIEDTSLSVTVRSLVPILAIDTASLPDSLLAGETRWSSLTLTNVGQVALTELRFACNLPSFAFFAPDANLEEDLYQSNEKIVAGNSIHIANHIKPNKAVGVPLGPSGSLAPEASVTIPIMCRGDMQGGHILRWAFSFKGDDAKEELVSRALKELVVLPSLEIRPVVRASQGTSKPFLISLEIANNSIPEDVIIHEIASISPRWSCSSLEDEDDEEPSTIGWQQSSTSFVAVSAAREALTDESSAFMVGKLDELLRGKDVKGSTPGQIELFSGKNIKSPVAVTSGIVWQSVLSTHTQLRHRALYNQLPTIPRDLHQYLFTLFNARSIDLLVFWSIPTMGLKGHHHLADIPLGSGTNELKEVIESAEVIAGGLYAESQRERALLLSGLRKSELGVETNPVEVVLNVEDAIEHDFAHQGGLHHPISLCVRNSSVSASLSFTLELGVSSQQGKSQLRSSYVGSLVHHGEVRPLGSHKVSAAIWISRPGTLDVGDWRMEVMSASGLTWTRQGSSHKIHVRDRVHT